MSVSTAPAEHVVLHGVRWETYERLSDELESRRTRLTYDRGTLEIMTPSRSREHIRHRIRRMIEAMTEELDIPIQGGGATTWRRRDLEKGLEANECYWVRNEPRVRALAELDLTVDPPPDLAIEVDVYSSSLNRMSIYGALGVPEVWRWDDGRIVVSRRTAGGTYVASETSACFPWLPLADFTAWIDRADGENETAWIRAFRGWVRAHLRR